MNPHLLHEALLKSGKKLSLAESCTGGKIAATLAAIPGASGYLLGSIVAYSNDWKQQFLRVSPKTLQIKGAVSAQTVEEMLSGLFAVTSCDLALSVSGIAGPTGGSAEKPVGTIYIASCKRGEKPRIQLIHAPKVRQAAIDMAVDTALAAIFALL